MGVREEPIWDGNGGTLDPAKATQRDMLVALHIKTDQVIIPALAELKQIVQDHEKRIRDQEDGDLSRGQEAAIRSLWQGDKDASTNRRNLKMPAVALVISLLALVPSVVLMIAALSGGSL